MPFLCPHCLQPLPGGFEGNCPHCGRTLENHNQEGALPFGAQLGGTYTVGSYLGADGDGLCYRGVHNGEKRYVLIKEYFPVTLCNGRSADGSLMPKKDMEVLFKTSRMDFKDLYDDLHRITPAVGLSQILEVLEENNTVYAIEESEKGTTLTQCLKLYNGRMKPEKAVERLRPVMEGVALLHKAGLIHRGICPDNILLPIDGPARLTGYGTLALRTGGSELKSRLYDGYAAPEQYSAAEFSGRYTDVYALAAVTYYLVTGETPVAAPQRRVRDSLENAHSLESSVPADFAQVLDCALRLDPARRMQTVPELMSALDNPSAARTRVRQDTVQISTRKIMGASLAAVFVLAALLLWSLLRSPAQSGPAPAEATPPPAASDPQAETPDVDTIPKLEGLHYKNQIENSDLYAGYRIVMTEQFSSDVEAGYVMSQEPMAGMLRTGDDQIIQIVVSKGPHLVPMPDILGFTRANACKVLDEKGIQYRVQILDNDGSYAEDCVIKADVKTGTKIDTGKVIVSIFIADERDNSLVAETSGSEDPASESSPKSTTEPE